MKTKQLKVLATVFLILSIIFAVVLVSVKESGNENMYEYNTFTFKKIGDYWYTDVMLSTKDKTMFTLEMRNDPKSIEHIPLDLEVKDRFYESKGFFLTAHPNLTGRTAVAMISLHNIISEKNRMFSYPTVGSVTHNVAGNDLPVVNCSNSTADFKVIWFGISNTTQIDYEDNCFRIEGTNQSQIMKASERFTYEIMGII